MRDLRISLAVIVSILMCAGVMMIFSSSGIYALEEHGQSSYYLRRHLLFLTAGFFLMLGAMSFDYRRLQNFAKPLLTAAFAMLVLVLVPGIGAEIGGAQRWFKAGGLSFQPSEFAKMAMIIYLADYLCRKRDRIRYFRRGFLPVMIVLGVFSLLILRQPDMGTTVYIAIIYFLMIFIAGARLSHLALIAASVIPAFYFLILEASYRLARIVTFLDPWSDPLGAGFQLTQSQIALGSGGVWGVGLGKGMQKLFYLPAAHTDFILSIVGEELGLWGTLSIVFLFSLFIWQGARIAKRVSDPFGYYLSTGLILMIGLQAAINIGVSIGALPTKGLPLPFISYGGSALVFNLIAVGLLLNISRMEEV